ncbi:hypothetical protein PFISCL1PPCAC_18884, partial [Pristionchus fissidentatus]
KKVDSETEKKNTEKEPKKAEVSETVKRDTKGTEKEGKSTNEMKNSSKVEQKKTKKEKRLKKLTEPERYRRVCITIGRPHTGQCLCVRATSWEYKKVWPKSARIGLVLYWVVFV